VRGAPRREPPRRTTSAGHGNHAASQLGRDRRATTAYGACGGNGDPWAISSCQGASRAGQLTHSAATVMPSWPYAATQRPASIEPSMTSNSLSSPHLPTNWNLVPNWSDQKYGTVQKTPASRG